MNHKAHLLKQDWWFEIAEGQTILMAAQAAGIRIVSSCRNGSCRTCLCKIRSGQVQHVIEWPSLSYDEKTEGYALACVATADTDLEILTDTAFLIDEWSK